jgi:hypothetical protein
MSEVQQSEQSRPDYEPPTVEKIDTDDSPLVVAAGFQTRTG